MASTHVRSDESTRRDGPLPPIELYPVGGFRPVASFSHDRALFTIEGLLIAELAPASLVSKELFVPWDPGNLRTYLAPDVLVVLGAGELDPVYGVPRRQYRLWDEQGPPDIVFAVASPTTVERDTAGKKEDYARLGVREYVLFDPVGDMLDPRPQVFTLRDGAYQPVPASPDGSVNSVVLPHRAWVRAGNVLRTQDRATGLLIPTPEEAQAAAKEAQTRAEAAQSLAEIKRDEEATRAAAALRAQAAAEIERDAERTARAREALRANEAEEELRQLRAELARLQADRPAD